MLSHSKITHFVDISIKIMSIRVQQCIVSAIKASLLSFNPYKCPTKDDHLPRRIDV